MARTINWNREKLAALKTAYEEALRNPPASGHLTVDLPGDKEPAQFVVSYAKYLVEYLEGEFMRNPPPVYPENREGDEP